jgi:hypothetical protein
MLGASKSSRNPAFSKACGAISESL